MPKPATEKLGWLAARLSAMSIGEVAFRFIRLAQGWYERARIRTGWDPGAEIKLHQTRPLFTDPTALDRWQQYYQLDAESLTRTLAKAPIFFSKSYSIGQPTSWHRDPETGVEAPLKFGKHIDYRNEATVGNIKILWELGRHQHLVPVAVAYAITGETQYRDFVQDEIFHFIEHNPFGLGVHWCSSLEVALRAIAWSICFSLIALRDGPNALVGHYKSGQQVCKAIYQHGLFIRRYFSRHSSANNHLIGELVGLWTIARTFDLGESSSHWERIARDELTLEFSHQVHPDGVAKEQATHYQLEVMEYLLFAYAVGTATEAPLDEDLLSNLQRMRSFIDTVTLPEGGMLQLGDSDEATVNRFRPGILKHQEEEFLAAMSHALEGGNPPARYDKAFWYREMLADNPVIFESEEESNSKDASVRTFPDGGYVVASWHDTKAIFDAGPLGFLSIAAHGHADALSICLAHKGQWWLVDPGTYAYHGSHLKDYRSYFKGTRAHNTLSVEDQDQSISGGTFLWLQHAQSELNTVVGTARAGVRISGQHWGYEKRFGVIHERVIKTNPEGPSLSLEDRLQLSGTGERRFTIHFHFAPDIELELTEQVCFCRMQDRSDQLIMRLDPRLCWTKHRGSTEPILGWYSAGLGKKEPAWTLKGAFSSSKPISIDTELEFTQVNV
ncbi:MAG: alginate lyase family protein [Pseudomonadota bacterium]